jgi:hypothetical protein
MENATDHTERQADVVAVGGTIARAVEEFFGR